MKGSINSIESFGAVDGPGIRTVVFLNGCPLRCKFCHNPEMWKKGELNYTPKDLVDKIVRNKPYFKNNGGVTFSGGEPLMQPEFLLETIKLLKDENIHIALDTSGQYIGDITEIIKKTDLIIYDIKDITKSRYKELTNGDISKTLDFINLINQFQKKIWIRQVIVPNLHDSKEYMHTLNEYIKNNFDKKLIEKIEFLPYHKLGSEKYETLKINNPYKNLEAMNEEECKKLHEYFMKIYEK